MRKYYVNLALTLMVLSACLFSQAASFEKNLRDARQLLDQGDPEGALALLKEAQVDYPDVSELRFGIACALFAKGEQLLESGAAEESKAAFKEARSLFDSLETDPNKRIAREATYNSATTVAREALGKAGSGDYAAGIAALRGAIEAYETGLARYPDHDGMRQNLDHVQFKLKELLQNKPPEQETPEEEPPEQPQEISRFGQTMTDIPGATIQVEENTAVLVPPENEEPQP